MRKDISMRFSSLADNFFSKLSRFGDALDQSQFLERMLKACLLVTLGIAALRFAYVDFISKEPFITDFNAFYLAGKLALERKLAVAYDFQQMNQAQLDFYGIEGFLPWSYPPPFDLIVALLAIPPIGVASFLFSGFSLLSYLHLLDQVAGGSRRLIRFILLPTLLLNLTVGQNGLLTGMLLCSFCGLTLKRSPWAGIPLGLMIIKPHLAVGFVLFLLLARNGPTLRLAALTAGCFAGVSTWLLGPDVWFEFAHGIRESASFLKAGVYPLFRMTSFFANIYTLTDNLALSQAIQAISIALATVWIFLIYWLKLSAREQLGMVALTSPFFSPYFYDYDLPIIGIGIALLYPAMTGHLKTGERITAITSFILAESGWIFCLFSTSLGSAATPGSSGKPPSLGAPLLLIGLICCSKAAWRAHKASRVAECAGGLPAPR
jgi:hypothetical protein